MKSLVLECTNFPTTSVWGQHGDTACHSPHRESRSPVNIFPGGYPSNRSPHPQPSDFASLNLMLRDFPASPVVKTLPSDARAQITFLLRGLRSHMAPDQKHCKIKQKQYYKKFNNDFLNGSH